ncbi:MAG: pectate lyase [Opitutus sp.]|nr:pectate lyase [Opitutus sp.]
MMDRLGKCPGACPGDFYLLNGDSIEWILAESPDHPPPMKKSSPLFTLLFAFVPAVAFAATAPQFTWETPPGWTETRGGADGKIIRVTTLASSGPGSFAAAVATEGPRTIEFAVAGVIDLGGRSVKLAQPNITIAGETAPSPGITLTNGGLNIGTHDVIVRHIRIRPGAGKRERKSGWEIDGISTIGGAHDVIVDHCSLTWATDENLSASGPRFDGATPEEWRKNTSHRVTFSHNLIGEGLNNSTHIKGSHSKGSLIHDNASDIAIIGNLYISNDDRNPLFKGGARGVVVNNLIHNPGRRILHFGLVPDEWQGHEWLRGAMVAVGNVARQGPSTAAAIAFIETAGPVDVHLRDNLFSDAEGTALPAVAMQRDKERRLVPPVAGSELRLLDTPPLWPSRLKARPASETAAWVLANAGARAWERDAIDRRLVEEAKTGGGRIIDFESEVGGLPR